MQTGTLLLIVLAAVVALGLAVFQYFYKTKKRTRLQVVFAMLRFVSVFAILLLLINPTFTREELTLEKTNLVVLLDDSGSLRSTGASDDLTNFASSFLANNDIHERFTVHPYTFAENLSERDSLSFDKPVTDISKALKAISEIHGDNRTAVLLASDGNQTQGEDYEFYGQQLKFPVFSLAVGDTTSFEDVRIDRVNANKYAFLKNEYPIEILTSYFGNKSTEHLLTVSVDGTRKYSTRLRFSPGQNTQTTEVLLKAETVGQKNIKISLSPLNDERNTANNTRFTSIEVIDEKTDIALVSRLMHPDLGVFKRAIESNEQRSVVFKKPTDPLSEFENIDLFILYQPDPSFAGLYRYLNDRRANLFTVAGTKTNWGFLNGAQKAFSKNDSGQQEAIFGTLNKGFSGFGLGDFSILDFPPLTGTLGEVLITKTSETLIAQRIKGIDVQEPLLAVIGDEEQKQAVLFAEGLWKWRMQSFQDNQHFENFDEFMGKLIRYLASDRSKSRLSLDYEGVFQGSGNAKITANYFDKAFVFDPGASLMLKLNKQEDGSYQEIPMLLKKEYYEADLSNLLPGRYTFTVQVSNENLSRSGSFTILDFDIEQQFLSANYAKLSRLSQQSGGSLFFPGESNALITELMEDNRLKPTQKSNQNVVSLIDFRFLLGIIALSLAAEWFLRKYNGLI